MDRRDVVGWKRVVRYGSAERRGTPRKILVYSSFFARFSVCSFVISSSCSVPCQNINSNMTPVVEITRRLAKNYTSLEFLAGP